MCASHIKLSDTHLAVAGGVRQTRVTEASTSRPAALKDQHLAEGAAYLPGHLLRFFAFRLCPDGLAGSDRGRTETASGREESGCASSPPRDCPKAGQRFDEL